MARQSVIGAAFFALLVGMFVLPAGAQSEAGDNNTEGTVGTQIALVDGNSGNSPVQQRRPVPTIVGDESTGVVFPDDSITLPTITGPTFTVPTIPIPTPTFTDPTKPPEIIGSVYVRKSFSGDKPGSNDTFSFNVNCSGQTRNLVWPRDFDGSTAFAFDGVLNPRSSCSASESPAKGWTASGPSVSVDANNNLTFSFTNTKIRDTTTTDTTAPPKPVGDVVVIKNFSGSRPSGVTFRFTVTCSGKSRSLTWPTDFDGSSAFAFGGITDPANNCSASEAKTRGWTSSGPSRNTNANNTLTFTFTNTPETIDTTTTTDPPTPTTGNVVVRKRFVGSTPSGVTFRFRVTCSGRSKTLTWPTDFSGSTASAFTSITEPASNCSASESPTTGWVSSGPTSSVSANNTLTFTFTNSPRPTIPTDPTTTIDDTTTTEDDDDPTTTEDDDDPTTTDDDDDDDDDDDPTTTEDDSPRTTRGERSRPTTGDGTTTGTDEELELADGTTTTAPGQSDDPQIEVLSLAVTADPTHQGNLAQLALPAGCEGASNFELTDLGLSLEDVDDDPTAIWLDTESIQPGSYGIEVDCGETGLAAGELFVYRQNGAERGGARTILILVILGLLAAAVHVGSSAIVDKGQTRDQPPEA